MNPKTQTQKELQKLQQLLEHVRQKKLGLDWQSKTVYKQIEDQIIEKIKALHPSNDVSNVVK